MSKVMGDFIPRQTLTVIPESQSARLVGKRDQCSALSHTIAALLMKDKERYLRSLPEDVEGHFSANDLQPANQGQRLGISSCLRSILLYDSGT